MSAAAERRRVGYAFKTTVKGKVKWKAQEKLTRTGPDDIFIIASTRDDTVNLLVEKLNAWTRFHHADQGPASSASGGNGP
jgi:hypothetical protein